MHAHHALGFIELEPLAIGIVDLVYVIVALMCLLLVAAGWVILYVLHLAFGRISILGSHPFNFLYGLMTDALKSVFTQLEQRLVATGHFFWALGQMIWRPLFVILQLMQWSVGQIIGVQQHSNQGLAQVRAQEQQDIANLRAQENANINALRLQIDSQVTAAINNVNNRITSVDNTLNTRITSVQSADHAFTQAVENALGARINADEAAINNDYATLNTRITNSVNGLNATITRDVNSLTQADAADLTTAKNFATNLVSGLGVGTLRTTLTALQSQVSKIQTETDDCLTPLCDTVTPQAPRLGRLGNLLGELEALGIEALLIALAAECLTNPGAVASDVNTVVQDIGNPLMTGFRDLVGA